MFAITHFVRKTRRIKSTLCVHLCSNLWTRDNIDSLQQKTHTAINNCATRRKFNTFWRLLTRMCWDVKSINASFPRNPTYVHLIKYVLQVFYRNFIKFLYRSPDECRMPRLEEASSVVDNHSNKMCAVALSGCRKENMIYRLACIVCT